MRKTLKSLLSTSLALLLTLTAIPSNASAVNTDTNIGTQFKFSHLVNVDNDDVLIFTYLGSSAEEIEIQLTNENGATEEVVSLTAGNTSAEFYDIFPGDTYGYAVRIGEEESISGTLTMTEDGVNYMHQQIMPLATGQTFQAKNGWNF